MRIVLLIMLVSFSFSAKSQTINPFLSLKCDKVVLYDYEPSGEDPALVNKGSIVATVKIKKQVEVDRSTINNLNKKIGDKKSYGHVTAMCFDPHLGIVYYFKNRIVREVLVCMECNTLRADIDIPAQHQNKQGNGKTAYYLGEGMSKSFRHFLNGLMIKYSFSHQIKVGSIFDK